MTKIMKTSFLITCLIILNYNSSVAQNYQKDVQSIESIMTA